MCILQDFLAGRRPSWRCQNFPSEVPGQRMRRGTQASAMSPFHHSGIPSRSGFRTKTWAGRRRVTLKSAKKGQMCHS